MDLDDLYRLLRSAHVQAQGVMDTIRDPLLVLDDDLMVLSANPAFYRTFEAHRDDTIGSLFYELGDGQWNIAALRTLLEEVIPKSAAVFDYEVSGVFPRLGVRTMLVSAQRLVHPDIGRRVLLLTIVDATQRRNREDDSAILVGELNHRVKNLLSITRSLATQTTTAGRTANEYKDALLGRFDALARALEVSGQKSMTDLTNLVQASLEPYVGASGTVTIGDCPPVPLSPQQAVAIGMILQELASNALKHGALSIPEGQVTIDWCVSANNEDGPEISLRWKESGGPEVISPTVQGFGTRMITYVAQRDLAGSSEHSFESTGCIATLTFPQHWAASGD